LIGVALSRHPDIRRVLEKGILVIIAGSTNGYVAEELLKALGQEEGFTRNGFRRGVTAAPGSNIKNTHDTKDVVIVDGEWQRGKTVYDVADELKTGDLVLKGANAFDGRGKAAVQIGNRRAGTIGSVLPAVFGRRVKLIVPVGLEKRVLGDVGDLVVMCNDRETDGPRLCPLPGRIFTELDAIKQLTGAEAFMLAAGGIHGAEGSVWIGVKGEGDRVEAAEKLIREHETESPCRV
jgi:hypothetical protein